MTDKQGIMASALKAGSVLPSAHKDVFGNIISYRIEEVLGAGGYGITYKATDGNNYYAIKECFCEGFDREKSDNITITYPTNMTQKYKKALKDFEKEAKRLMSIRGETKYIVKVVELIQANNTLYYAMEFLQGKHLRAYTKGQPLREQEAIKLLKPIIEAVIVLQNAEEKFMHLDIKPENIVLTQDPYTQDVYPVLIDFGVSKGFNSAGGPTSSTEVKGISRGYSPIEQYSGAIGTFDARYDVHALGATMYFLLTGKDPKETTLLTSSQTTEYIRRDIPASVSERVRDAVIHAMQHEKDNRTPNAKTFLQELSGEKTSNNRTNRNEEVKTERVNSNNNDDLSFDWKEFGKYIFITFGIIIPCIILIFIFINSFKPNANVYPTPTEEIYEITPTTTPTEAAEEVEYIPTDDPQKAKEGVREKVRTAKKSQADDRINAILNNYYNAKYDDDKFKYVMEAKRLQTETKKELGSYSHSELNNIINKEKNKYYNQAKNTSLESVKKTSEERYNQLNKF